MRRGWNKVFVQPDLTPKQKTARRQLVMELKEKQLGGELNLMIVNGKIASERNVPIRTGGADCSPDGTTAGSGAALSGRQLRCFILKGKKRKSTYIAQFYVLFISQSTVHK